MSDVGPFANPGDCWWFDTDPYTGDHYPCERTDRHAHAEEVRSRPTAVHGCKRDVWTDYPIDAAFDAAMRDPRTVIVADDYGAEFVNMPADTGDALREFNRRLVEGDLSDCVATDPTRPDPTRRSAGGGTMTPRCPFPPRYGPNERLSGREGTSGRSEGSGPQIGAEGAS